MNRAFLLVRFSKCLYEVPFEVFCFQCVFLAAISLSMCSWTLLPAAIIKQSTTKQAQKPAHNTSEEEQQKSRASVREQQTNTARRTPCPAMIGTPNPLPLLSRARYLWQLSSRCFVGGPAAPRACSTCKRGPVRQTLQCLLIMMCLASAANYIRLCNARLCDSFCAAN